MAILSQRSCKTHCYKSVFLAAANGCLPVASWRHVVPALVGKVALFIPELPGYGISSPAHKHSKLDIGRALLEALEKTFDIGKSSPRNVILGGHDRGARICHRLAVSRAEFTSINVVATILLDIVPTKIQWDKFQNPAICQGYYHWPLLANADIAVKLISAYGGAQWCRDAHSRLARSEEGARRIQSGNAVDVYAALFDKEETLRYSAEDYAAGAAPEYAEQVEDQKAGRKLDVPTMVMFSKAGLGSRIDVAEEWRDWITAGTTYEPVSIGNGYGHYLPEEAHDLVSDHIQSFIQKFL